MSFRRELGPFDATMIVIGGIIGSGIFINPYIVARQLDSPALVLGAWAMGGAVAIAGALAYAELAKLLPRAGGQYVYLRDAWHPVVGFLYGWALLLMIETGAIAAVAIAFSQYTLRLAGAGHLSPQPLAVASIVVLSVINYFGVKPGSRVTNFFVVLKVAALAVLILFAWFQPSMPGWLTSSRVDDSPSTAITFGAALIPILFAYGGWQVSTYLAEEMRDPVRHLPRALILGTLSVVAIYLLVNVAYLRTLGLDGLAATTTPAAETAGRWFGTAGERFVAMAIAISTFGFLSLVGAGADARVLRDGSGWGLPTRTRPVASEVRCTGSGHHPPGYLVDCPRTDGQVRGTPRLGRVRGLDLLWPHRCGPVHPAEAPAGDKRLQDARVSVGAALLHRRCDGCRVFGRP